MPDKKEFQDAWVVVTGGSRGIGRAIALEFASKGAHVALVYLSHHSQADEVVKEVQALGVQAEKHATNVADHAAIQAMFAAFIQAHRRLDVLVNCAGINRDKTLAKLTAGLWQEVLDTNLTGAFNCSQAVWDQMKAQNYGRIVSISSIIGQAGGFGQTNYSASKAGLLGFTKSLAQEGARIGITANAICPGFIDTDMVHSIPSDILDGIVKKIPVQRLGQPEEIARTVSFLASPHSGYITGQVINVNGGLYM
ncbi:MAG TPA: beta-ketoacyl-ACP reductase [Anaerolineales bacterium]|jgi:acetoacetyl-CoA reductase